MLDLGWSELLIIFVLALVVLGPRELPKAIRKVTGTVKQLRKLAGEFQSGLDDLVKDTEFEDARSALRDVQKFNPRNQIKSLLDPDDDLSEGLDIDFEPDDARTKKAKADWRKSEAGKKALGVDADGDGYGAPDADADLDEFPVGEVPPKYRSASTASALKGGETPSTPPVTTHVTTPATTPAPAPEKTAEAPVKKPTAKKPTAKKATTKTADAPSSAKAKAKPKAATPQAATPKSSTKTAAKKAAPKKSKNTDAGTDA